MNERRPKIFAFVKKVGTDKARLDWIERTFRKRGLIPVDPKAHAAQILELEGRDKIDKIMLKRLRK